MSERPHVRLGACAECPECRELILYNGFRGHCREHNAWDEGYEYALDELKQTCCCFELDGIQCSLPATFHIDAVRSSGIAGPDLYSDDTYSCEAHVGALLGHQPNALNPEEIYWEVKETMLQQTERPPLDLDWNERLLRQAQTEADRRVKNAYREGEEVLRQAKMWTWPLSRIERLTLDNEDLHRRLAGTEEVFRQQVEKKAEELAKEWAAHAISEEHERSLAMQQEYLETIEELRAELESVEALRRRLNNMGYYVL